MRKKAYYDNKASQGGSGQAHYDMLATIYDVSYLRHRQESSSMGVGTPTYAVSAPTVVTDSFSHSSFSAPFHPHLVSSQDWALATAHAAIKRPKTRASHATVGQTPRRLEGVP